MVTVQNPSSLMGVHMCQRHGQLIHLERCHQSSQVQFIYKVYYKTTGHYQSAEQ